jgi:hypothetical protein
LKIIIEVWAAAAVLRVTLYARITFAIMADATVVEPSFIGEENIGAKVYRLSDALQPPSRAS